MKQEILENRMKIDSIIDFLYFKSIQDYKPSLGHSSSNNMVLEAMAVATSAFFIHNFDLVFSVSFDVLKNDFIFILFTREALDFKRSSVLFNSSSLPFTIFHKSWALDYWSDFINDGFASINAVKNISYFTRASILQAQLNKVAGRVFVYLKLRCRIPFVRGVSHSNDLCIL